MSTPLRCPYCSKPVDVGDSTCNACFFDLRNGAPQEVTSPTMPQSAFAETDPYEYKFSPEDDFQQNMETVDLQEEVDPLFHGQPSGGAFERRAPGAKPGSKSASANTKAPPVEEPVTVVDSTIAYRPRLRPPMALLVVIDDGANEGEVVRIRKDEFKIGRSEGDLVIPHEKLMSSSHACISRRYINGAYRWFLSDLNSTNGTFVKLKSCVLHHNTELMFGSFRYKFDSGAQGTAEVSAAPVDTERTMGWKRVSVEEVSKPGPSLTRLWPNGNTEKFKLSGENVLIGSAPTSDKAGVTTLAFANDPMLSKRHLRIYRDEHRRWKAVEVDALNGIWIAVQEREIDKDAMFQLGEQRFSIKFP